MHLDELYPSKWINAAVLAEGDAHLTIKRLEIEVFRDDEDGSPVLYFEETEKGLPLNKTNATTIAELYGPETDEWPGRRITLYRTEVEYAGKTTWGVRVRLKAPAARRPVPVESENEIPF